MQKFFHKQKSEKCIYVLANEETNEKRYFLIKDKPNNKTVEDITLQETTKRKEKVLSKEESIEAIQGLLFEMQQAPIIKPEYYNAK